MSIFDSIVIDFNQEQHPVTLEFFKYENSNATGIRLHSEINETVVITIDGSASGVHPDFIVVADFGEFEGLDNELLGIGLIHPLPFDCIEANNIYNPVYELTDEAIDARDAQLKKGFMLI